MIYILKIKGTNKIPDFVQIRDKDMSLIAYFRLDQISTGIKKSNIRFDLKALENKIQEAPFGKIQELETS